MKELQLFLLGIFVAGIVLSSWWVIAVFGVLILLIRRSYLVLIVGVILDIIFAIGLGSPFYGGFYTILFFGVTLIVEQFRSRII